MYHVYETTREFLTVMILCSIQCCRKHLFSPAQLQTHRKHFTPSLCCAGLSSIVPLAIWKLRQIERYGRLQCVASDLNSSVAIIVWPLVNWCSWEAYMIQTRRHHLKHCRDALLRQLLVMNTPEECFEMFARAWTRVPRCRVLGGESHPRTLNFPLSCVVFVPNFQIIYKGHISVHFLLSVLRPIIVYF